MLVDCLIACSPKGVLGASQLRAGPHPPTAALHMHQSIYIYIYIFIYLYIYIHLSLYAHMHKYIYIYIYIYIQPNTQKYIHALAHMQRSIYLFETNIETAIQTHRGVHSDTHLRAQRHESPSWGASERSAVLVL